MLKIKVIGYQRNADFTLNGQNFKGSRLYYVADLNEYQKNNGAVGMLAGSQFLSAQRFNYPIIEVGAYYNLDVVKRTAVSIEKIKVEENKS